MNIGPILTISPTNATTNREYSTKTLPLSSSHPHLLQTNHYSFRYMSTIGACDDRIVTINVRGSINKQSIEILKVAAVTPTDILDK